MLGAVQALAGLSSLDPAYADLYLQRARALLPLICSREHYLALHQDRERAPILMTEIRAAAERGEWSRVRALAEEAARGRERVVANQPLLRVGDAVYGSQRHSLDPRALALAGIIPQPSLDLGRAQQIVIEQLRELVAADAEGATLYRSRLAHFETLNGASVNGGPPAAPDAAELQQGILRAADEGDLVKLRRLTDAMLSRPAVEETRPSARAVRRVETLDAALPESAGSRASAMGLAVETLAPDDLLHAYMGGIVPEAFAADGDPLPVPRDLRDNLDLLRHQPFVSSVGTRYLPLFGSETLLVETFAETDCDAPSPLLDLLELGARRSLSRLVIEEAIHARSAEVCRALGLDLAEFAVVCIPFDAYLRLAPRHDWGRQRVWTHFDGYQLTRSLRLRAMVGGDVRYGGPADLCSVDSDYDAERLILRLAVVQRRRLLA